MAIKEIFSPEVVCASRDRSVKAAAKRMREYHVGNIVVVDELDGKRVPAGFATNCDVAVEVVTLSHF